MKLGIVGLPASGKTTLFDALTGESKPTGQFGAGSAVPNVAVVSVPDERMKVLQQMFGPKKEVYATIEYWDIVGIFDPNAHVEHGALDPMSELRRMDGVLEVVRAFEDPNVPHPADSVDPERDARTLASELMLADLDIIERRIEKLEKTASHPSPTQQAEREELDLLARCRHCLENEEPINALHLSAPQQKMLSSFQFVTQKPSLLVWNIDENQLDASEQDREPNAPLLICAKLEMELMALDEADREEFAHEMGLRQPAASRIVQASYRAMNLASFFTIGDDEIRAWTIPENASAVEAAGKVHTDMARGFIRAEVVAFDDLAEAGSMQEAQHRGKVRLEGKEYPVRDGDVIRFRFSV